jgi:AraC-like DNA-binding protein
MAPAPREFPKRTFLPPAGRPSWIGSGALPLIYLGWGTRNFARHPLPIHRDWGTNYYVLLRGQIVVRTADRTEAFRGPAALFFDADCAFGIGQERGSPVEILVWIWQDRPLTEELRPPPGQYIHRPLEPGRAAGLLDLHLRCRDEVAIADERVGRALLALRELVEVEIVRSSRPTPAASATRWKLAQAWLTSNLAVRTPVPALCEYLRMSPSTLHRFFRRETGVSPGAYLHQLKMHEAERLIHDQQWKVKEVAFHLGYRHANDLSRALASHHRRSAARSVMRPAGG